MKKYFSILLYVFFITSIPFSFAENTLAPTLQTQINKILSDSGENLNVGLVVENLTTGKVLYKKNPDRYFMPASNEKLFTAFAALESLGPGYVYQTRLFADLKKVENGVLNDHVYLQFSGDPNLGMEQLNRLISALTQAGIQRINGSIIIDDTAFDTVTMSPGTSWEDKDYCFGAPLTPLIVEKNCVSAFVNPGEVLGSPAKLRLPNQPQFIRFVNDVINGDPADQECKPQIMLTDEVTYTLNGCIKTSSPTQVFNMPIHNPRSNIQASLTYLFNKNLIAHNHDFKFQKIDLGVVELAHAISPPLQTLVKTMLKESDNLIANSLFKTMGAVYTKRQGTWKNGSAAAHDVFARTISIDLTKLPLIDGAGSSRYNLVTPQQIIALLRKAYSQPYRNIFISSLPVSGVDGTLKKRMNDPKTVGKIYAKTGSMLGVTALSGYLITRNQQTLVFTILINGFVDAESKYKDLEDKICSLLVDANA